MTIEEAIRAKLLTMSAVTAITSTIRADELMQSDVKPGEAAILISVDNIHYENTLDGKCNMAEARITVSSVSGKRSQARALGEAIRTNGTNPGTGLAGCTVTTGDLPFQLMLMDDSIGYVANGDGSDSGLHSMDSEYFATFNETT